MTSQREFFKKCSNCTHVWPNLNAFLSDPAVEVSGYLADFVDLHLGLILFRHHACKTTLSTEVNQFSDLYNGPVYQKVNFLSETCPGYCLHENDLEACPAECECAWIRQVIQIVRGWPKSTAGKPIKAA